MQILINTVLFTINMSQTNFHKEIKLNQSWVVMDPPKGLEMKKLQWLSQHITVQNTL